MCECDPYSQTIIDQNIANIAKGCLVTSIFWVVVSKKYLNSPKILGGGKTLLGLGGFLDAIASPSTCPCQSVSQSVSQWVSERACFGA